MKPAVDSGLWSASPNDQSPQPKLVATTVVERIDLSAFVGLCNYCRQKPFSLSEDGHSSVNLPVRPSTAIVGSKNCFDD